MGTMTLQTVADSLSWISDLVPFLLAPLALLLVFEVAVLLAAILATDRRYPDRSAHSAKRTIDQHQRPRLTRGRHLVTVLALAVATGSCADRGSDRDPVASCTGAGCGSGVASVAISPASISIGVGETAILTAAALDANGIAMTGVTFSWSSANDGIVRIDQTGTALGVAEGSTSIRVTAEGRSATAGVTVTRAAAPASRILFSSDRTGSYEVHSMTADGGDVRRLTNLRESSRGNHPRGPWTDGPSRSSST